MRRLAAPASVVGALLAALPVLLLLEGRVRGGAFRAYALVVGVLALRAVVAWSDARGSTPVPAPFVRPRLRRHEPVPPPADRSDQLVRLASHSAGDAHRGLRPALQVVADERLQARHGRRLADAESLLSADTWELLRPDRPRPVDGRAPGIPPERIDAVLTELEAL